MDKRLRDFMRMNPPIFTTSKTSEDPQEFVDEVHKIFLLWGPQIPRNQSLFSISLWML